MSNTQTTTVDPIEAAILNQKLIQKDKNWKESELSKARKARNKELAVIDNACAAMVKNLTDNIQIAQIKLAFEAKKLEIKAQYQPKIDALKVQLEEITEGAGSIAGEKIGAVVAPVSKGVKGFFSSLKERAL